MSTIILSAEQRVTLLKAGLTGRQVETVFVVLNGLRTINAAVLYDAPAS